MVTTSLTSTSSLIGPSGPSFVETPSVAPIPTSQAPGTFPLSILDTGENYILALDSPYMKPAMEMYDLMGVTITPIATGISASMDAMNFVYETLGRIFSTGFADNDATTRIDIPSRLQKDIPYALEMYKATSFWKGVRWPPPAKQPQHEFTMNNKDKLAFPTSAPQPLPPPTTPLPTGLPATCVFYNTIYNLCVVYTPTVLIPMHISDAFPEFELVFEVPPGTPNDVLAAIRTLFHLKSFDTVDEAHTKYAAFKTLFNLTTDATKRNEIKKVKDYFEHNYVISNSTEKRVKANDLYKEVINHMCINWEEASMFKKRLAGYLLEMGLTKRRYSDAYYYFGLEKKSLKPLTVTELIAQREKEKAAWVPPANQNVLDSLEAMRAKARALEERYSSAVPE